jgi:hypothetical protein
MVNPPPTSISELINAAMRHARRYQRHETQILGTSQEQRIGHNLWEA